MQQLTRHWSVVSDAREQFGEGSEAWFAYCTLPLEDEDGGDGGESDQTMPWGEGRSDAGGRRGSKSTS